MLVSHRLRHDRIAFPPFAEVVLELVTLRRGRTRLAPSEVGEGSSSYEDD